MKRKERILNFIETIRESFVGAEHIYTRGSCYRFFKILKFVFPSAKAYYDGDHVITKIGKSYYDITGEVERLNHIDMEKNWNEFHDEPGGITTCRFSIYNNVMWCEDCDREALIK